MNIVDSSGWLAYFADEPNAKHFLAPLKDTTSLVVPAVTIYEVFKVVLRESSENEALQAVAASKLSLQHHLPIADSIILATSQVFNAKTWTQDSYFKNISGVKYFPKK